MFFYLSKILFFLLKPYLWIFTLTIIALIKKDKRLRKRFAITAGITFYFFSNAFIVDEVMRHWEIPATTNDKIIGQYDYGIVLGGMSTYDPSIQRINFQDGIDRLLQALDVYKSRKIKKIIITGGSGSIVENETHEAAYLKKYLIQIGIPENDILIDSTSRNTHENAVNTALILGVGKSKPSLLFTSASHIRRAMACFKKQGIVAIPFATNRIAGPRKFVFDHLFIPTVEALLTWELLIKEMTGYTIYFLMGYV